MYHFDSDVLLRTEKHQFHPVLGEYLELQPFSPAAMTVLTNPVIQKGASKTVLQLVRYRQEW